MSLRLDVVDRPGLLSGMAAGWSALVQSAATPFQTFGWHLAWWELVGARELAVDPHVVTFHDGGRLCAVAPLALWRDEGGPTLRFSSDPWADYHDVLVDRNRVAPKAVYALLREHLERGLDAGWWAQVELRELPTWSELPAVLGLVPDACVTPGTVCPRLDLGDPESYARATGKREYETKRRRLARRGRLECRFHGHPGDITERMPDLFAMHLRRWIGRPEERLTFDRADMIRFFQGCPSVLGASSLLLCELLLDERPISYYLGFLHRRTFWGYCTTFDADLERFSPGGVIHQFLFRFLREQGYETFDFMRVDHPYKSRYASELRQNRDFHWRVAERQPRARRETA